MKYPQLVSTKAVNEISDWLIKRLEELDIEHPGVYSRLLLSLLHTPFKVNAIDLLEDLKEPYRFTNKNNEELKRLAAVESLLEVSAEENKSSIVRLVDELHLKLRKFENNNCEESPMSNINSRASSNSLTLSPKYDKNNNNSNKNLKKIKKNHGNESSTKNYYLAFPALNGNKKIATTTTSTTSAERKPLLTEIEESNNNNSSKNTNLLSWSNLMSNKKDASMISSSSLLPRDSDNGNNRTPRRKRRYGKAYKSFPKKNDVQFTTKSFTMYDNATFSPKKMQMVKNSNRKHHQRNQYDASTKTINKYDKNCGIRNNNFSNAHNAPKLDELTTGSGAPWDMDFKGHWEMDRDLISEFIQQQKEEVNNYRIDPYDYFKNDGSMNFNNIINNNPADLMIKFQEQQQMHPIVNIVNNNNNSVNFNNNNNFECKGGCSNEDEEDVMLMKCLPTKLISDESLVDDPLNAKVNKPSNIKETLSISSLKSKFDENVKAIWGDAVDGGGGYDTLKPLTYKHFEDEGSASLASSFTSEKNSLSLFNFNEQTHHFAEFNAPCTENYQQQQQQIYKNIDYDCNNNYPMAFYGGRGAISKSSSFTASPRQLYSSDQMTKSDFIKSGTNLQTSIWSDSGDFTSDAESLIFKEVADPISSTSTDTDAIYKNLSSIGAEMKQHWQTTSNNNNNSNNDNDDAQDNNDVEVTLFNHHSEKSAFKKFRPIELSSTIIRANYHPSNVDSSERTAVISSSEESEPSENYLTSEKTHFEPIIRDGHTFEIDNNWDEIEWERSSSGGIMYKNKRYKVWNNKRLPNYENDIDLIEIEKDSSEFIIKYIVCENDKECQANESDFIKTTATAATTGKNHSFVEINEDYCKRKIYDEYFKGVSDSTSAESRNKWRFVNNSDDSNDYSFFTVNRVKNNQATSNNSNNNLSSQTFQDILLSSNSSSSSICTITSSYDASESWRNVKVDGNNMIDSEYNKQTQCMHRLWEQCLSCAQMNEDPYADKSLPANRLMKDELKLDGDEIMNVIQNLYITSDYCDDDEEKEDDCEEFDMNHVYMNMIMDDSMDGTCTLEEDENKFYEPNIDAKNQKNLTSSAIVTNGHHHHHQNNVFNLENFDEITLTHWQWNKNPEKDKNHEKYMKLLNWIRESLLTNNFNINNYNSISTADTNNNDCQNLNEVHRPKNRKRRHSTCQNLLENKRYHTHEDGFTYHLNLDNSTPPSFLEDPANHFFIDAAKMLKVNIEKILLIHADPSFNVNDSSGVLMKDSQHYKDQIDGANYYRNILQQQHALIKQLDLSRPLTR